MGNENSKNRELTKNGNIPGKHSNGSVNGPSANITSNGLEIAVNTETIVQQSGEPFSLELATESTQPEILETIIHKKEVKKGNEDQTDVSLPATNPQPESASSGEEAVTVTVTVHREDFQYPQPKTEMSTQTDGGNQADISTQTSEDDDDDTTTKATEGDPLHESSFVMAEEVVEDTAYDEPRDNQTAGNISEEMVVENVYRAEWAEVTGIKNYSPEEKIVNGREETELEIAAEPEPNPKESIIEDEIDAEENNIEEPVPLEVFYSLPKVVTDCVEVVFAAISESTDSPAVNTSDQSADEVITEDNGEGAGDVSARVVLIKTAEPESNAATPEAIGANGVPSPGQEPATTVMETISEIVREEPNHTPVNQDTPVEELSVPPVPVRLVRVESAHEKVSADDAVAVEDIPGIREQEKLDDERECDRCPEEEMITVEAPPNDFIIIDELPEDTESIPEVMTTDEDAEVGVEAITYVGQDTFEEAELSPFFVKDDAELTLEAAIDALSLEFESIAITPPEPAVDNGIPPEEEVITARTFVPLSGELVTENIVEEAANVPPTDAAEESEPCVSVQEEHVEENIGPAEVPSNFTHAVSVEPKLKNNILVVLLETIEDEVTEEIPLEPFNSGAVLAAIEENCEDATSDEPVSECVKAVLETIVEDIITEDVAAECNRVTSEEVAPQVLPEGETEEKAEEAANLKQASESLAVPESVTLDPGPEKEKAPESDNGEDSNPEENPVMNFFKTLVTPKITKKETATPGATKDQSQMENQPAVTTTVAQVSEPPSAPKGMSYPPPPPPEPPRMEIKGEPAAKPVKPTPKEEPKAAAKEAESPKGKSARVTLSKFFRPKVQLGVKASKGKGASASGAKAPAKAKTAAVTIKDAPAQPAVEVQETPVVPEPVVVVEVQSENNVGPHETAEEVAQPVVEEQVEEGPQPVVEAEKVDPSKAGTLEAAAKPEPPPPVQEAKKTASKSSFFSLFKPKAADPQKASPAPAAAAETVKAKEEPKAAAKSSEVVIDNKPASVASKAGDDAANVPRKLEKRNSIHLFFKNLGQKRNSTDAGVQTEPVPVAPAAEKAK